MGIFLGAFPCGVVPLWDELFGSESTSQVYGVFIEYLSQLPDEERERLKDLIYDDNCHLSRFALRSELKTKNKVTKFFAENVRKTIDKGSHKKNTWSNLCHCPDRVGGSLFILVYVPTLKIIYSEQSELHGNFSCIFS